MTKIKLFDHYSNVSHTVFRAIHRKYPDASEILKEVGVERDGRDMYVNVEMTVNGKPVDVVDTLTTFFDNLEDVINKRAFTIASEMVTSLAADKISEQVDKIRDTLRDSEWAMRNALREWMRERGLHSNILDNDD